MDSEILIIGAGVFGTSTAYHLSLTHPDPSRITIIDTSPYPPTRAASNDISKIVRADYSSPFYMEMAYEAMDAWTQMPIFTRADVFHRSGWVMFDEKGKKLSDRMRSNFRNSSRADVTEDFTEEDARMKWDGLLSRLHGEGLVPSYANPSVAWVDAGRALGIMLDDAVKRGVRYVVGEVERIELGNEDEGIRCVHAKGGKVYTAKQYLLATGAWTSQLMSTLEDELGLAKDQRVESQVSAFGVCVPHFRLSDEEAERFGKLPIVVWGDGGELLPMTSSKILKFNTEHYSNTITTPTGHKISVPPNRDQSEVSEAVKQTVLEKIRARLPQILENGREVDSWRMCWDSASPDGNQLMTRHPHPKLSNLYFAIGGSAHSWKFLPILGKYVIKVLNGVGNGPERDQRWGWKDRQEVQRLGAAQPI